MRQVFKNILSVIVQIITLTVYINARILKAPLFWLPLDRYSMWIRSEYLVAVDLWLFVAMLGGLLIITKLGLFWLIIYLLLCGLAQFAKIKSEEIIKEEEK